jgi:type II secretory pathway pseudopilin PulG/fibronectin type 3 domain-containing protein
MSRHFWQACDREAGFSFVELLVTIIIAGIAFAAMVPVFVQAQQATSGDLVRNAALQLAQDKLEKVRGLDYDLITTANLQSSTFADGQFGTSVTWTTGGGGSRTFLVAYQVDLLPVGSTLGNEKYKQVTITASWNSPPQPVAPVQLSTMVSMQYAGPQIIRFDVGPDSVLQDENGSSVIISGPVELDAFIAPEDILSMNQAATEANRGYVLFTVTSLSGTQVDSAKVTSPVSGVPAHYTYSWDNSTAANGVYILQAVAVAGFGSRAQGMPVSIALKYENLAPPAPTSLTALPGDGSVILNWVASSAGDIDYYEVWRSTDGVTFEKRADVDVPAVTYSETGLTNGTTYYYKVRVVNTGGVASPFTEVLPVVPAVPVDIVPPTVPTPLVAQADAAQPTVHLSWPVSIDGGSPTTGLAGYNLERSPDGITWTTLHSLYQANTYDDTTAGWSSTWRYRVQAVDFAGNSSAYAAAGPVTTAAPILRTIRVTNNSSTQMYVWVQNAATLQWFATSGAASATRPVSGVWVKKNGNSVTWSNLSTGIYNVYFLTSSTWNNTKIKKTLAVDVNAGNGFAAYP